MTKSKLNEYVFTFGFGQPHENCYHVIHAKTRDEAREKMIARSASIWIGRN